MAPSLAAATPTDSFPLSTAIVCRGFEFGRIDALKCRCFAILVTGMFGRLDALWDLTGTCLRLMGFLSLSTDPVCFGSGVDGSEPCIADSVPDRVMSPSVDTSPGVSDLGVGGLRDSCSEAYNAFFSSLSSRQDNPIVTS